MAFSVQETMDSSSRNNLDVLDSLFLYLIILGHKRSLLDRPTHSCRLDVSLLGSVIPFALEEETKGCQHPTNFSLSIFSSSPVEAQVAVRPDDPKSVTVRGVEQGKKVFSTWPVESSVGVALVFRANEDMSFIFVPWVGKLCFEPLQYAIVKMLRRGSE